MEDKSICRGKYSNTIFDKWPRSRPRELHGAENRAGARPAASFRASDCQFTLPTKTLVSPAETENEETRSQKVALPKPTRTIFKGRTRLARGVVQSVQGRGAISRIRQALAQSSEIMTETACSGADCGEFIQWPARSNMILVRKKW